VFQHDELFQKSTPALSFPFPYLQLPFFLPIDFLLLESWAIVLATVLPMGFLRPSFFEETMGMTGVAAVGLGFRGRFAVPPFLGSLSSFSSRALRGMSGWFSCCRLQQPRLCAFRWNLGLIFSLFGSSLDSSCGGVALTVRLSSELGVFLSLVFFLFYEHQVCGLTEAFGWLYSFFQDPFLNDGLEPFRRCPGIVEETQSSVLSWVMVLQPLCGLDDFDWSFFSRAVVSFRPNWRRASLRPCFALSCFSFPMSDDSRPTTSMEPWCNRSTPRRWRPLLSSRAR